VTSTAEVTTGPFWLHARVPGDMASLAVEDDEQAAAAAHAALADGWLPAGAPPGTRQDMLGHLAAARRMLRDGGASWLGLTAGDRAGRWSLMLISITATPFDPPAGINPAQILAAMLRARYPVGTALVEEFGVPGGPAAGIRRAGTLDLDGRQLTAGSRRPWSSTPAPARSASSAASACTPMTWTR